MALDLTPSVEDIIVWRGDNPVITVTVTDPVTGLPVDLTGGTFAFTVNRNSDGSATNEFQLTPTNTPSVGGVVTFQPTTLQMGLARRSYFYDVQWTSGSTVRTLATGRFIVRDDINN